MRAMTEIQKSVTWQDISIDEADQRLDNYLMSRLKGVPKSMVYRIVRKGEVRVNKKRVKPDYRLKAGDQVRIPPVRVAKGPQLPNPNLEKIQELEHCILYEDDAVIVVNKPSGTAVHGGSGLSFGLIEGLRALRPKQKFLELVHRLDRETSGILLIAKKRSALKSLHAQLRDKTVDKTYVALVHGEWPGNKRKVDAPLQKNTLKSGERIVRVNSEGKASLTRFAVKQRFNGATLVEAMPVTGRTHQIRVHAQYAGHPIAQDPKYGLRAFDLKMEELGLQRLFLHATRIQFTHPITDKKMDISAPLEAALEDVLRKLNEAGQ